MLTNRLILLKMAQGVTDHAKTLVMLMSMVRTSLAGLNVTMTAKAVTRTVAQTHAPKSAKSSVEIVPSAMLTNRLILLKMAQVVTDHAKTLVMLMSMVRTSLAGLNVTMTAKAVTRTVAQTHAPK